MIVAEFLFFALFFATVQSTPIQFPENVNTGIAQQEAKDISEQGEGRFFHAHGIKKKVKKKIKRRLLQCLISAVTGRSNNPQTTDPQGRTIFLNFYDINLNTNGDEPYDDSSNNFVGICGGHDSSSSPLDTSSIGEGINNLGSFVGQNPIQGINNNPSNDVKPVYENPERFLNRYVLRPLYGSLRPFYSFF